MAVAVCDKSRHPFSYKPASGRRKRLGRTVDASRIAAVLERAADSGDLPGVVAAAATKNGMIFRGRLRQARSRSRRADGGRHGRLDRLDDQGDHLREIKALEEARASESAIQAAEDKAAANLEELLRPMLGPVEVKGFPPANKPNLALSEHEEEFGDLDGLTSYSDGQHIVVTTRPLPIAWLKRVAKDEVKERRLPTDADAAVRQDGFYTFSAGEDSVFATYADLPVMKPTGVDLAVSALGVFQQADGPWPADAIVATVIKGDRVLVGRIRHRPPIGEIPACGPIWAKAEREQATETLEQGDKDYRACFSTHAPNERFFAGLTKEAQSLVNRLAGGLAVDKTR
jgi:hypothetical protein